LIKHIKTFFSTIKNNLIALLTFLIIWQISSIFFQNYIVPSPVTLFSNFDNLMTADLLNHFQITLYRIFAGFLVAFIIGTILGFISYIIKLEETIQSVLVLFQVLPGTVLGIIFLLIFGQGNAAPVALIITLTTPLIAINTSNSLFNTNKHLSDVIIAFGGNYWDIIKSVHLPSLVPVVRSNCTIGFGFALKIVVLGEFIASQSGLGYLLNVSKVYFNMKEVFFYLFILITIMLVFQIIINLVFVIFFDKYLLNQRDK